MLLLVQIDRKLADSIHIFVVYLHTHAHCYTHNLSLHADTVSSLVFSGATEGQRPSARRGRQSGQAERRAQTFPILSVSPVLPAGPALPQSPATASHPHPVRPLPQPAAAFPVVAGDRPQVGGRARAAEEADAPSSPGLTALGLAAAILAEAAQARGG